jgi:hypothetical protein
MATKKKLVKKPTKKVTKKTSNKLNHVAFVIDSSGSMSNVQRATVDSINSSIKEVVANTKLGQKSTVSQWLFGVRGGEVEQSFFLKDAKTLTTWAYRDFKPQGQTPLFDGVGLAIERFSEKKIIKGETFLMIVVTDGEENASRIHTKSSLQKLMSTCQATDHWTFAFLVPPGQKNRVVSNLGIPDGNVTEWEATTEGVRKASVMTGQGIGNYYGSLQRGLTSSKSFFSPDLSKVKHTDVKKKLDDMQGKVLVLKVHAEAEIRSFVEMATGRSYTKGNAFYQLSKDEKKVQDYKQILIREKTTGKIYGGDDVRQVLGLPVDDVKIRPGNHGNFDIFIQSTSVNRKLVRGTFLLYLK